MKDKITPMLIAILFILSIMIHTEWQRRETADEALLIRIEQTQQAIDETRAILNEVSEWIDKLNVGEFDLTGYAPHDPDAVAGMCHDGNPDSTATGTYPTPGRTIATDTSVIPMGSRVYIEGIGYRVAEDKGGLIKGNRIDIVTASRAEAYAVTREKVRVIYAIP